MKKIILIIATVAIVATASWAGNSLLLLGVGGPASVSSPSTNDVLLQENGDALLLESGDKLLLE